jgi:prepilin-type N-terminal cleavage/methylation domain-containing protein
MSARPGTRRKAPRTRVRRTAARAAGFSLVEILIALAVFMVGALSLSVVMPMATRRIVKAASQTRASELSANCAEQILVTPWDDTDLTAGSHNDPANPRDGVYYVSWAVLDSVPVPNCKQITVNVSRNSVSAAVLAQVTVVVPRAGATDP